MPRRDDLSTILLIGSGPIVIGQACEFDYSGTQACRVLAAEGSVEGATVTHVNLNDGVIEGFDCRDVPAFSVQYHPEAGPGPHDARYLFREFSDLMDRYSGKVRA